MYDMDRTARQIVLAQDDQLEGVQAQAATYVRSRAVDEVEAQVFLEMLGIES
jgi:hypothetical protein